MSSLHKGRTQPGRLDALDLLVTHIVDRSTLPGPHHALDVGIGTQPHTTLALFDTLRRLSPEAELLAIDNAPARVDNALAWARPGLRFAHHDLFEAKLPPTFHLVRAVNVLRSFPPPRAIVGRRRLFSRCAPGGLLLEGSTNRDGDTGAVFVARRTPIPDVALLLFSDESHGVAPGMFRGVLPQDVARGGKKALVEELFAAWDAILVNLRGARGPLPELAPGRAPPVFARSVAQLRRVLPHVEGLRLGPRFAGLLYRHPALRALASLD